MGIRGKRAEMQKYVQLKCDGYMVILSLVMVSMCRLALTVLWINGTFKSRFLSEDCEERKRFLYPRKAYLFPLRIRKRYKRSKSLREMCDRSWISYDFRFPGMRALVKHFEEHNASIEVVSSSYFPEFNG
jgi:hypothetical protein